MLGIVFPGQGSQSVGMLADMASTYPLILDIYREASHILGYDMWALTQRGPAEELDKTVYTQPALLTASYAIWSLLQPKIADRSLILAGHSLGEYTALVCAGALSFTNALKLVAARGQYMQEAVPAGAGALAAIVGLEEAAVKQICQEAAQNEILAPANYNSIGQIVIAGQKAAIERAIATAKLAGAKLAKLLPVSVPSHCELMKPAAAKLETLLKTVDIQSPKLPVINNVDVKIYQDVNEIRSSLVQQLFMPVRWVETMKAFMERGVSQVIECGPGKVLTGLNKRIVTDISLINTAQLTDLQSCLKELL